MPPVIFTTTYYALLLLFILSLVLSVLNKPGPANACEMTGWLTAALGCVLMILITRRLPFAGRFETGMVLIFLISGLNLRYAIPPGVHHLSQRKNTRFLKMLPHTARQVINRVVIVALLAFMALGSKATGSEYTMYDNVYVNLFFHFRVLATGFFLFAASSFTAAWYSGTGHHGPAPDMDTTGTGRNFLLLGACCFLISECAGSWWCLNWLGDVWQWNKGFFKASGVFLMVMTACHLPGCISKSGPVRLLIRILPAGICFWMVS
ncbi:MAG: hypothetical protein D3926_20895 [Desulfobacteraceae bacterium]|nr:MAG: hypothetical protein D3926_20895 [Desulfobacteraceae bacterium]